MYRNLTDTADDDAPVDTFFPAQSDAGAAAAPATDLPDVRDAD